MRVPPYQRKYVSGLINSTNETYLYVRFGLVGNFHQEIRASIHHMLQNLLIHSKNVLRSKIAHTSNLYYSHGTQIIGV